MWLLRRHLEFAHSGILDERNLRPHSRSAYLIVAQVRHPAFLPGFGFVSARYPVFFMRIIFAAADRTLFRIANLCRLTKLSTTEPFHDATLYHSHRFCGPLGFLRGIPGSRRRASNLDQNFRLATGADLSSWR